MARKLYNYIEMSFGRFIRIFRQIFIRFVLSHCHGFTRFELYFCWTVRSTRGFLQKCGFILSALFYGAAPHSPGWRHHLHNIASSANNAIFNMLSASIFYFFLFGCFRIKKPLVFLWKHTVRVSRDASQQAGKFYENKMKSGTRKKASVTW